MGKDRFLIVIPSAAEGSLLQSSSSPALLIRLHETPYSHILGISGFPFLFTRIHRLTANEKDFSLSLEMTVRGNGILTSLPSLRRKGFDAVTRLSLLPMEGGAP